MANTSRGLRLLALDGGGVRGLSELIILEQLMYTYEQHSASSGGPTKKPCEVFDIICGTSTGGLIAILLGCFKLTVKEAITEYELLSKEVFGAPRSMFSRRSRYSGSNLEKVIKTLVKKYKGSEDEVLVQTDGECKVFVCTQQARAIDRRHAFLMRSYDGPFRIDGLTIWQAARATSAAPTFFERLEIGTNEFIDGGIGFNNPSKALLRETRRLFEKDPDRSVTCIISIGTGVPKRIDLAKLSGFGLAYIKDLVKALSDMATDCQEIAEEMTAMFKATPNIYVRFDVEQGLQDVRMDSYEDLNIIRANTQNYLMKDAQQEKLTLAASLLASDGPGRCRVSTLDPVVGINSSSAPGPLKTHQCIELSQIPPLTKRFFGRQDVLEDLHKILGADGGDVKRVVIWGFPGSGKTSIALRYIQRFRHEYRAMIWVNALNQQTVQRSIAEAAGSIAGRAGNLSQTSSRGPNHLLIVKQWLRQNRDAWLLVIDSVDDLEQSNVLQLLPDCSHGAVLITSSKSDPGDLWDIENNIEVRELDEGSSVELLCSKIKDIRYPPHEKAINVVNSLHRLPLAIEHAAVALRRRFSIDDLQKIIDDEARVHQLLAKKPNAGEWAYSKNEPLYAILEHLARQLVKEEPLSASIFTWLAFLGPGEISRYALLPFASGDTEHATPCQTRWEDVVQEVPDLPDISIHLADATNEPVKFWESVRLLEDSWILLHNTIQKWAMSRVNDAYQQHVVLFAVFNLGESLRGFQEAAVPLILQRSIDLPIQNIVTKYRKYLAPALQRKNNGLLLKLWRNCAAWLGRQLVSMRNFKQAQEILKQLIDYDKLTQGPGWPSDASSLGLLEDLGDCHRDAGDFETARASYTTILRYCRSNDNCEVTSHVRQKLNVLEKKLELHKRWQQRGFGSSTSDVAADDPFTKLISSDEALKALPRIKLDFLLVLAISASSVNVDVSRIKVLLDLGARFSGNRRFLEEALCSNVKLETLAIMLGTGAYSDLATDQGDTLRLATKKPISEFESIALLLLQHGADPKSLENEDDTPLLVIASIENMPKLVRKSLDNGATPDGLGAVSRTPLTYAAKRGHSEIVRMLLEGGANPSPHNPDGSIPIQLAGDNGHSKVVDLLLSRGTNERDLHRSEEQVDDEDDVPLNYPYRANFLDRVFPVSNRGDAQANNKMRKE
ncbi:hypothetical protein KCU78_g5966, partial [Aureobasidium melanogenum]